MNVWRIVLGLSALVFASAAKAGATETQEPTPPQATSRGAAIPWVTYEAEQARTNGSVLGPDYTSNTPVREASGRQCVRLDATGQFVQFTAKNDARGLVVRYCLPDSPDGRGRDATLSCYINGTLRGKLPMTSRFSYLYGDYPFTRQPGGKARHFWDEVRVMPGAIRAGDVVRLQKDTDDGATQYLIDSIDLEAVPDAIERPGNSVSIIDFGAVRNSEFDSRPAIVAAIASARKAHEIVWIPPGRFVVKGEIDVHDVTIQGAGMWYSTLVGGDDYSPERRVSIQGEGSNVTLSDFAIIGKLNYRNDSEANDGVGGSFGTGSCIRNIWIEHTKTGLWLVNSEGLLVEGCRFRNTIADGCNLCLGMKDTIVRNCTARGTGDDCFAMWPATYHPAKYEAGGNRFIHCTAQLPSLAQGFSIYGGNGNSVEKCKAIDIPYGAGVLASTMFPTVFGFKGVTTFYGVDMTRAGDADGAVAVMTNLRDLPGVRCEEINVIDSPTDGIKFNCVKGFPVVDASFEEIHIDSAGIGGHGYGINVTAGATGSAIISNVTIVQPKTGSYEDSAPAFNLIRGAGNVGIEESNARLPS